MTERQQHMPFGAGTAEGVPPAAVVAASIAPPPAIAGMEPRRDEVQVRVTARLDDLAHVWPRSRPQAGPAYYTVFQTAGFLSLWLDTIGRRRAVEPCFVAVKDAAGRPLMLLALGLARRGGVTELSFLDGGASDYNAPVLFEATPEWSREEMRAVWAGIERALPPFDVLRLDKMLVEVGGRRNPLLELGARPWECSGHAVTIRERKRTRELPNARASRRKLKRLNEIAPARFGFAGEPAEIDAAFGALMTHKARRFAETRVPGFEKHPGLVELYRAALADERMASNALLATLYCGETPIAEQWCLKSGDSLILLVCGNAGGAWSNYSPGRLLNEQVIAWAEANGFASVDFGIGDEPYKAEYCDARVALAGVVAAHSLRGRIELHRAAALGRLRATRAYQRIRPLKWTAKRWLQSRLEGN